MVVERFFIRCSGDGKATSLVISGIRREPCEVFLGFLVRDAGEFIQGLACLGPCDSWLLPFDFAAFADGLADAIFFQLL